MFTILSSTSSSTSITQILSYATEVFTWVVTQMGALITFISANPVVLFVFILGIVGFVVGFLARIWTSFRS